MTSQIIDLAAYKIKKEIDEDRNKFISQYPSDIRPMMSDIYTNMFISAYNKWHTKEDNNEPD